jgi:hypothetical protein
MLRLDLLRTLWDSQPRWGAGEDVQRAVAGAIAEPGAPRAGRLAVLSADVPVRRSGVRGSAGIVPFGAPRIGW